MSTILTPEIRTEIPHEMGTDYGKAALTLLGCVNPEAGAERHYKACNDAELRITASNHYNDDYEHRSSPVILLQDDIPVGIIKPWGEKTGLGIAEASVVNPLLFPGSITEMTQEPVSILMRKLVKSDRPVVVDLNDLQEAIAESIGHVPDTIFRTIRMSGLGDPMSRAIFGVHHQRKMVSLEDLNAKAKALLKGRVKRVSVDSLTGSLRNIEAQLANNNQRLRGLSVR